MTKLSVIQGTLLSLLQTNSDNPLTIRELQDVLDVSSPSLVHHHIRQLEKKGYLRRSPSNPKDYHVISDLPEKEVEYLNVYGVAHCGPSGSILDGSPVDRLPISTRILGFPAKEGFIVKAKGDSMEPYIYEGDYIIARVSSRFKNGDVIVCSHDGEVKIKKIKYPKNVNLKNTENEMVLLISHNQKYSPEVVSQKKELQVVGIVTGVLSFRNFSK